MKKRILSLFYAAVLTCALLAGCGKGADSKTDSESAKAQAEESDEKNQSQAQAEEDDEENQPEASVLEDGIYNAKFGTDSSMFHVNEACEGKGTLTVEGGKMTIHVSLVSQNIVKLFAGTAEDAQKQGAKLLEPTTDTVTYSDGTTEEVYGFDIPVPVLDEEFDVAILGTKGVWYDHKVSVSEPEKAE